MVSKPRIAFCFSGQARTLDQTYIFFQKNLFDAAKEQGFDYDVFCAVEDDEDVDKVKLLNPTKVKKIKSSDVEKIIEEKHGNFINKELGYKYCFLYLRENSFINFLQQLYKVMISIEIAEKYAQNQHIKYSLVVRLRFDRPLFNKINFKKVDEDSNDELIIGVEPKLIWPFTRFFQISDWFFVGNMNSMHIFHNLFYNIEKCFRGEKTIKYRRIFIFFSKVKNLIRKIHFPVTPIWLIESYLYTVFSPEKCYQTYIRNYGKRLSPHNFSNIIFRKNIKDSDVHFFEKNQYEI